MMENAITKESLQQMQEFVDGVDQKYQATFRNMHQGYPETTLERFLRAREGCVEKACKMLLDCLIWRVQNDIDSILAKPIQPKGLYDTIRDAQLMGVSGYCKKGRPVFAIGVGLSSYEKAPVQVDKFVQSHIQINEYRDTIVLPRASRKEERPIASCIKILDMTGLKLSAMSRMKILTAMSTVDDLNYPEKTDTYYIVNAPYVFTACWKAVRPMLQERTKKKIQVLKGCGREELLKVMDLDAVPLFARFSGSSSNVSDLLDPELDCFSAKHKFHVELWNHMQNQAELRSKNPFLSQGSVHVKLPGPALERGVSTDMALMLEHTFEQAKADENANEKERTLNRLGSCTLKDKAGSRTGRRSIPPLHRA